MPPNGSTLAVGQRFDIRVEATGDSEPPHGLRVFIEGKEITSANLLAPGPNGERGVAGTGAADSGVGSQIRAGTAPRNTTNFLVRAFTIARPGKHMIEARVGAVRASASIQVGDWNVVRAGGPSARNVILLMGDGMGLGHRTAARLMSRGLSDGRARDKLAMEKLDVTGVVMTASLNAAITDSSPGMSAYVTGVKGNNEQSGVFPDNTVDSRDNPRVEYLGELLRRTRGPGFNVGLVTNADITDATPAANAVHISDRSASTAIAAAYFDEREANGISVLLGGGSRHFDPRISIRQTGSRNLREEFQRAGFELIDTRTQVKQFLQAKAAPARLLGLFHPSHLPVAFDKVGAGKYSDELARPANSEYRDAPMLDELAALALKSLSAHSPRGFYLMIEGGLIDKRAHAVDAERTVWDVIEFDNAVKVALDFANRVNRDSDSSNDTLVIVTSDHETGGLAPIAVGNERYQPEVLRRAVRDYAAVFRFGPTQELNLVPNYEADDSGYPKDPDPSRKLLLGWAAAPDHFENWISNRLMLEASVSESSRAFRDLSAVVAAPNLARDSELAGSDNKSVSGVSIPGVLVTGAIENGQVPCPATDECPGDTKSVGQTISGHTATDIVLAATGPGALQFTGVYENTDVFLKILRSMTGHAARVTASQ